MKTEIIVALLIFVLAACTPAQSLPVVSNTDIYNTAIAIVQTNAALTQAAMPTSTPTIYYLPTFPPPTPVPTYPTATPQPTTLINQQMLSDWRTQIALVTPIRTPVVGKPGSKLPRTYSGNGNVYFQNSAGQIVQLTSSGIDRDPLLSDDGQKIVFYRGETADNLYSIYSDGSDEQKIITTEKPLLLGKGEIASPTFVPSTHILLFNTYLCGPRIGLYHGPECTAGVFSVDTDTGKIEKIVDELSGSAWKDRNFEISPNGKFVSVAGSGRVDVYTFSLGKFKIIYPTVITYHMTTPDEYLPQQYWLPDSRGLIFILAADGTYNDPADPPANYTAFRYIIADKQGVRISLDKFITRGDGWSISPDRNWMLFTGNDRDYYEIGVIFHYLANLNNGHTQAYEPWGWPLYNCRWSPDSKHFASINTIGFIGSVDGSQPLPVGGYFLEWIDSSRYYYAEIDFATGTSTTYIGTIGED